MFIAEATEWRAPMLTKRLDRRLWAGPLLGAMLGWESDGGRVGKRVKRGAHENVARVRRRKTVRDCDKVCDFCRTEVNEKDYKT